MKSKSNPDFIKKEQSTSSKQLRGVRSKVSATFNNADLFSFPNHRHFISNSDPRTLKLQLQFDVWCGVSRFCCADFITVNCCNSATTYCRNMFRRVGWSGRCHLKVSCPVSLSSVCFVHQSVTEQVSWDS